MGECYKFCLKAGDSGLTVPIRIIISQPRRFSSCAMSLVICVWNSLQENYNEFHTQITNVLGVVCQSTLIIGSPVKECLSPRFCFKIWYLHTLTVSSLPGRQACKAQKGSYISSLKTNAGISCFPLDVMPPKTVFQLEDFCFFCNISKSYRVIYFIF